MLPPFASAPPDHCHLLPLPTLVSAPLSHLPPSADTPQFFQSTKFFAVLDVEEAHALFHATTRVRVWGEGAGSRQVWVRVVLEVEEAHALFHATTRVRVWG